MASSHVRVVGSSMVEINCTVYMCAGTYKKNHFNVSSGGSTITPKCEICKLGVVCGQTNYAIYKTCTSWFLMAVSLVT